MINPDLSDIKSIINGWNNAKDNERVFTYIEFIKLFGYDNDINIFITSYKDYVTKWAKIKKASISVSDQDFVLSKLVDTLKAITLDYSSYEQQDFISHIDLTNKAHLKSLTALYSRKIREITEFYRKKRNESVMVVRKNSMKGSTKSIQEIVYEKVFDFIFSNKNIVPSYKDIKRDLLVSIQNYVDTYSQYFDIPRTKEFTDKTRAQMLSANMNDVDYRMYLEIELVVSQILFSGNVMLEEIPLIAQLGVDLSQQCVGDMLALKNTLLANTTVNQVDINEQIALKRRLYQKFLGCDLYYMYVDLQGNVQMDILCKAQNPTGNLLNCGTPDTATIQNEELELLSHIGLFFKPDKTSILKINAKDYTWTIDTENLINDTVYVFPDPNKYGDIGNNKSSNYPLIMEYKLDWDIKNISSGEAANDPMLWITDQGWASYYSKQDDDFKVIKNTNYEYAFTYLANKGYLYCYQTDVWGNQFGLLKGCSVSYLKDEHGIIITDENDNPIIDKITLNSKFNSTQMKHGSNEPTSPIPIILNGGYMENPFYDGTFGKRRETTDQVLSNGTDEYTFYYDINVPFQAIYNKKLKSYRRKIGNHSDDDEKDICYIRSPRMNVKPAQVALAGSDWKKYYNTHNKVHTTWLYKGIEENTRPFNFDQPIVHGDNYNWSGLKISMPNQLYISEFNNNFINYGTFGSANNIIYEDHFRIVNENKRGLEEEDSIITEVLDPFMSVNLLDKTNEHLSDIKIETVSKSFDEMREEGGQLYVKLTDSIYSKPKTFQDAFKWLDHYITITNENGEEEQVLLIEHLINGKVQNFSIMHDTIILETISQFIFIPYLFNGSEITDNLGIKELYKIPKTGFLSNKLIYNEQDKVFYILQVEQFNFPKTAGRRILIPHIYRFDPREYKIKQIINPFDIAYFEQYEKGDLDKQATLGGYIDRKKEIIGDGELLDDYINSNQQKRYDKLSDFEIPYFSSDTNIDNISFTFNSSLGIYLLAYIIYDMNGTPYIYEHKFKITDIETFHDSLVTNLYTIKSIVNEDGEVIGLNYVYNEQIDGGIKTSIPYDEGITIFQEMDDLGDDQPFAVE